MLYFFAGVVFVLYGWWTGRRSMTIIGFLVCVTLVLGLAVKRVQAVNAEFTRAHAGHEVMHAKIAQELETAHRGDLLVIGEEIISIDWVEADNGTERFTFVRNQHADWSSPRMLAVEHARLVRFGTPEHSELILKSFAKVHGR